MVLKRLKLQQVFLMVWHEIFPTHKHVKLHRICKKWRNITPPGNTARQHQCGKQSRVG